MKIERGPRVTTSKIPDTLTKTSLGDGISVIVICPSTWLWVVVSPSTLLRTVSLSNGLLNHLGFVFCYLKFLTF